MLQRASFVPLDFDTFEPKAPACVITNAEQLIELGKLDPDVRAYDRMEQVRAFFDWVGYLNECRLALAKKYNRNPLPIFYELLVPARAARVERIYFPRTKHLYIHSRVPVDLPKSAQGRVFVREGADLGAVMGAILRPHPDTCWAVAAKIDRERRHAEKEIHVCDEPHNAENREVLFRCCAGEERTSPSNDGEVIRRRPLRTEVGIDVPLAPGEYLQFPPQTVVLGESPGRSELCRISALDRARDLDPLLGSAIDAFANAPWAKKPGEAWERLRAMGCYVDMSVHDYIQVRAPAGREEEAQKLLHELLTEFPYASGAATFPKSTDFRALAKPVSYGLDWSEKRRPPPSDDQALLSPSELVERAGYNIEPWKKDPHVITSGRMSTGPASPSPQPFVTHQEVGVRHQLSEKEVRLIAASMPDPGRALVSRPLAYDALFEHRANPPLCDSEGRVLASDPHVRARLAALENIARLFGLEPTAIPELVEHRVKELFARDLHATKVSTPELRQPGTRYWPVRTKLLLVKGRVQPGALLRVFLNGKPYNDEVVCETDELSIELHRPDVIDEKLAGIAREMCRLGLTINIPEEVGAILKHVIPDQVLSYERRLAANLALGIERLDRGIDGVLIHVKPELEPGYDDPTGDDVARDV